MENRFFFIGFMYSGKTTIGKNISKKINKFFIDTDNKIEEKKKKSIFLLLFNKYNNLIKFRKLEQKIFKKYSLYENIILSTGGGIILNYKNRFFLKKRGIILFLNINIIYIKNNINLKTTNRPIIKNNNIKNIKKILNIRNKYYIYLSNIIIKNKKFNFLIVTKNIINILNINKKYVKY